jgi:hypothetical protein
LFLLLAEGIAFAQITWPVYASAGAGGAINPAGTVYVPDGAGVTFTFIPDPDYMVYQVIVDGLVVAGSVPAYSFEGIHGQHSILVTFAPVPAPEEYGPEVVVPGPGLFLFGGDFGPGHDERDFSRRGLESRREAHPEFREPERGREPPRAAPGAPHGGGPGGRR